VICPVGERQWEGVNWNDEGDHNYINIELGTFAGCCTPTWLQWSTDVRLCARGPTGRGSGTLTRAPVRMA
jgi:hypothetical protein